MARNIGVFAHIDAGKTTLTERILYLCGALSAPGSVDKGTAHTDNLEVERRRGISVRAASATVAWRKQTINVIDTPGHADFAFEVERALWVLDGAVLVVSAAEGVQPQTELLFEAMRALRLPVLIFLNKMDRPQADAAGALDQMLRALSPRIASADDPERLMELLAEFDERAMADYVAGLRYGAPKSLAALREPVRRGEAYLALKGSALRGDGVPALLDAILDFIPVFAPHSDLCGVVFDSQDLGPPLGRAAYVRLFSGELSNRLAMELAPTKPDPYVTPPSFMGVHGELRKITQVRTLRLGGRGEDVGALRAGEIGAVFGLGDVPVGQVLGRDDLLPRPVLAGAMREPLLRLRVTPELSQDLPALKRALAALSLEDPLLDAVPQGEAIYIRAMGEIQIEVIEEQLRARFGISARLSAPEIIYRETIARAAEGFVAYTMPKPCWAVLRFLVEPGPRGSGVSYESRAPVRDIGLRYQHQVAQAIPRALCQGRLGWQVDDVRITLLAGEHHLIHTHPLDFLVATPMGVHDALARGGSTLLEPILRLVILAPTECAGRVMSDIAAMRGRVIDSRESGGGLRLTCEAPAAAARDYAKGLAIATGGRGSLSARPIGYEPCDLALGATAARRGVDPLDRAKYILAARSALEGGIFD